MSNDNSLSRPELDDRIAILEDNLRQLVEQAAGASGGQTEERNADRIAQQREELDRRLDELDREGPVGIPAEEVLGRLHTRRA